MAELYQARFEGAEPDVKAKDGVVTIRYPRRLLGLGGQQRAAEATLNVAIPWQIVIQGGASEIIIRRPGGVAARAHLKGWVSTFVFDDQTFSNMGNNTRLQSSGFDSTAPYYDIEVASSASMVTITSG